MQTRYRRGRVAVALVVLLLLGGLAFRWVQPSPAEAAHQRCLDAAVQSWYDASGSYSGAPAYALTRCG